MRALRDTRGLSGAVWISCLLGLPAGASASEYYSWIERSGTMVLTDDLSSLTPATQRSEITVHRFADAPPAAARPVELASKPDRDQAAEPPKPSTPEEPKPAAEPRANAADVDLPNIRLDQPEDSVKWQYGWVPLTMPVYHGGKSIKGFWAHHQTGSPFAAFQEFLQRTAPPIQNRVLLGRMTGGNPRQPEVSSEVRFMRGLLALNERMIAPPQSIPTPAPRSLQTGGSRNGHTGAGR
jgi:hypothetical protein